MQPCIACQPGLSLRRSFLSARQREDARLGSCGKFGSSTYSSETGKVLCIALHKNGTSLMELLHKSY